TGMAVLQASLEADAGQHEAARARLERLLQSALDPRQAFRAHKELARVLDKLGEHQRVFPHLHKAAALSGSVPEIAEKNPDTMPAVIRSNRAGFDRDAVGRWAAADLPQERPPPVFLIGFMRSGTTLTQEVLGSHPQAFVSDESDLISATQRELHRLDPARLGTADKLSRIDRDGVV